MLDSNRQSIANKKSIYSINSLFLISSIQEWNIIYPSYPLDIIFSSYFLLLHPTTHLVILNLRCLVSLVSGEPS